VQTPAVAPATIDYDGRNWQQSGEPVSIDVVTTGKIINGLIIYRGQNDKPPYSALYIETSPNSGKFYKYVPAVN
jgi:hypothetical protein